MIAMAPFDDSTSYYEPTWTITTTVSDVTSSGTITYGNTTGSYSWSSSAIEVEVVDSKEARLQRAREGSWAALDRARVEARTAREVQPRQYKRPVSRGRVCSGSSRYRVMV